MNKQNSPNLSHLFNAETDLPNLLPLVRQLCEDRFLTLSLSQLKDFASSAGFVEQMYFNICSHDPTSEEIELTIENFILTCLPAEQEMA